MKPESASRDQQTTAFSNLFLDTIAPLKGYIKVVKPEDSAHIGYIMRDLVLTVTDHRSEALFVECPPSHGDNEVVRLQMKVNGLGFCSPEMRLTSCYRIVS